jgi:hypothetical protein
MMLSANCWIAAPSVVVSNIHKSWTEMTFAVSNGMILQVNGMDLWLVAQKSDQ